MNKFIVGDLVAIEARVLAWLAGQNHLLGLFRVDGDPYSDFATANFGELVRKPVKADPPEVATRLKRLREVGKVAILGLGYGMGALKHLNQLRSNPYAAPLFESGLLSPAKCKAIVADYRARYPEIPAFWADCESAFEASVTGGGGTVGPLDFSQPDDKWVLITLPSGRALRYPDVRLEPNNRAIKYLDSLGEVAEFMPGGQALVYGPGTVTYGGKLTENIVQAVSRDLLGAALLRCEAMGHRVVMHCHDELVLEVAAEVADRAQADLMQALTTAPAWAAGLPLAAEVGILERYDK